MWRWCSAHPVLWLADGGAYEIFILNYTVHLCVYREEPLSSILTQGIVQYVIVRYGGCVWGLGSVFSNNENLVSYFLLVCMLSAVFRYEFTIYVDRQRENLSPLRDILPTFCTEVCNLHTLGCYDLKPGTRIRSILSKQLLQQSICCLILHSWYALALISSIQLGSKCPFVPRK